MLMSVGRREWDEKESASVFSYFPLLSFDFILLGGIERVFERFRF